MRHPPSYHRRVATKHLARIKKNVDRAFDYGSVVAIRTRVSQGDDDAMHCPRCWDPVRLAPKDPKCSVCYGSGFASNETFTGYRMRIFSVAPICALLKIRIR